MSKPPFALSVLFLTAALMAQDPFGPPGGFGGPGGLGGPGGPGGPGGMGQHTLVREQFDVDHDGHLDATERTAARAWLKDHRPQRGRPGMGRGGPPGGDFDARREDASAQQGARVAPDEATNYPDRDLFDPDIVRTIFLEFDNDAWFDELSDFYHTDAAVPARVTVDGVRYEQVGASFRGNTSFLMARGRKKSFDLAFDDSIADQTVHGVRKLDLLNCNGDASFVREMLHGYLANQFFPAPRVALVRVVVNGEDMGAYAAVQQFDRDYLKDHYGTKKGARFKVPPDFSGRGGLMWLGEEPKAYERNYQLKSQPSAAAWQGLVDLCAVLESTADDRLEAILPQHLDVDAALWFLAIDNAVGDDDGYHSRASDYLLYRDPKGRFHPIPRDNNEILLNERGRGSSGPGAGLGPRTGPGDGPPPGARGPGGRGGGPGAAATSPLQMATREDRPLLQRLLSVPTWRERYLANLRVLAAEAMRVDVLQPRLESWRRLLDTIAAGDVHASTGYEAFVRQFAHDEDGAPAPGSLLALVAQRTKRMLDDASMQGAWPELDPPTIRVRTDSEGHAVLAIQVHAHGAKIATVRLHERQGTFGSYAVTDLHDDGQHGDADANDGVFGATLAATAEGETCNYWLEAVAAESGHVDCQPAGNGALPFVWTAPERKR